MEFKGKKIHMIGIKGVGMTALVEILQKMGAEITGSDTDEKFFTDTVLQKLGVQYYENFSADNIAADVDMIIYSQAYGDGNPEVDYAHEQGIEMLSYPEAVGAVSQSFKVLSCAGTDGKTTTSALLAHVLQFTGQKPKALVGAQMANYGTNALVGDGEYFVIESDEYKDKLQYLDPTCVLLTTVQFEHPDFFADEKAYIQVFNDFVSRIPKDGVLVANADDTNVKMVAKHNNGKTIWYSLNGEGYHPVDIRKEDNYQVFDVYDGKEYVETLAVPLMGQHNVANALAVFALCYELGIEPAAIAQALYEFKGVARRMEYIGQLNGALLYDDYAHTPVELETTIEGAKAFFEDKKITVVFMPHTYTRTEVFFEEFAKSFGDADHVVVTDIYGSAREAKGNVTGHALAEAIREHHDSVVYRGSIAEATEYLNDRIGEDDIVITMGAGNVWEVARDLQSFDDRSNVKNNE